MSGKALIRVAAKYRPVSQELHGFRLQAAIPNLAGRKMVMSSGGPRATSEEVPAFRKPYLIDESMDYAGLELISEADCERFVKGLHFAGYKRFEFYLQSDPTAEDMRLIENFGILSE